MFSMSDRDESKSYTHTFLVSYPMYALYTGVSVTEMKYERLVLKLKEGCTVKDE